MELSRRRAISAREDTAFFQPALLSRQSGRYPIWQSADVGQTTFAQALSVKANDCRFRRGVQANSAQTISYLMPSGSLKKRA
jgi:hypothetical protein